MSCLRNDSEQAKTYQIVNLSSIFGSMSLPMFFYNRDENN